MKKLITIALLLTLLSCKKEAQTKVFIIEGYTSMYIGGVKSGTPNGDGWYQYTATMGQGQQINIAVYANLKGNYAQLRIIDNGKIIHYDKQVNEIKYNFNYK